MAFKIRATLVEFMGDEKRFPCHFCYTIGDSFTYDGEEFHGRVCPGVLGPMTPFLSACARPETALRKASHFVIQALAQGMKA